MAPQRDKLIIGDEMSWFILIIIDERRIRPYLPNFSKIPASTIDPATGASTWAFGSHRWNMYKGIFVKNARIVIIHHIVVSFMEDGVISHWVSVTSKLVGEL